MEQLENGDNSFNNLYPEELLNLANTQVDKAISNALNSLTHILSSPFISLTTATSSSSSSSSSFQNLSISPVNRSLQPNVSIRCRSSSRNNRRDGKVSFHHTIPRCSLPATKNDLVRYQSRLLSYQQTNPTKSRSSQNVNSSCSNRTFDVQYSFSLNQQWLTKIDKQRHNLISIQNFVNELIEHSIRAAFLQIDYQNITNNSTSIFEDDTSCLLFDCSPSYAPVKRFQLINSYVDQFIHSTIKQSIEDISSTNENLIERLSNRFTENVISDALSTITINEVYSKSLLTDDEKHSRKSKKRPTTTAIRLINNENNESQTSLFQQIRHRSSSAFRTITNNNTRRETVDFIVNNLAQKIYTDSFDELRQIFTQNNGK
ncbi:unnamed protein product [Rotaria sp. Silwood1]|nr:unnamed protein product [Rotaria sp. Silwood1]CAF0949763.1 unnamed protein product [Rotaria sp. Silwood1]CAF3396788.1 unnamed protein product [Rotaria sp. Silwood1]CAF3400142.1 unnamed protein product [Rotaria sp. Silwood1]CAF4569062.1 unnamed protein product [Rotaria sp. Silwood1]